MRRKEAERAARIRPTEAILVPLGPCPGNPIISGSRASRPWRVWAEPKLACWVGKDRVIWRMASLDIRLHSAILYGQPSVWRLVAGETSVDVDVRGRFSTNIAAGDRVGGGVERLQDRHPRAARQN